MKKYITINNKTYEYELTRKRVKNINLRIDKTGKISVSANNRVSPERIDGFLRLNADFIERAVIKAQKRAAKEKELEEKSVILVWGKEIPLREVNADEARKLGYTSAYIDLREDEAIMFRGDKSTQELKTVLYTELTKDLAGFYLKKLYPYYKNYTSLPKLRIKTMTSRWGSCSVKTGSISINSRLAMYPKGCLLYVMIHEYTHFIHRDHSRAFYADIKRIMPDYRQWELLLKK